HPLAADRQPGIAVAAAAVRVALGHAVREPAPLVRAAPPLARLEAEGILRGQERRQGRHLVKGLDHLLPLLAECRISRRRARRSAGRRARRETHTMARRLARTGESYGRSLSHRS